MPGYLAQRKTAWRHIRLKARPPRLQVGEHRQFLELTRTATSLEVIAGSMKRMLAAVEDGNADERFAEGEGETTVGGGVPWRCCK